MAFGSKAHTFLLLDLSADGRVCWACEGDGSDTGGRGQCQLCEGKRLLPANPLDRRRRNNLTSNRPDRRRFRD